MDQPRAASTRKLLLHREEIEKIGRRPASADARSSRCALYFKDGRAKVEIALATGKREYDKRQTSAKREADRDAARALATRNAHGRARGR